MSKFSKFVGTIKTAVAQAMCSDGCVKEYKRNQIVNATMRIGFLGLASAGVCITSALSDGVDSTVGLLSAGLASTSLVSLVWLRSSHNVSNTLKLNIGAWLLSAGYLIASAPMLAALAAAIAAITGWMKHQDQHLSEQEIDAFVLEMQAEEEHSAQLFLTEKVETDEYKKPLAATAVVDDKLFEKVHVADRVAYMQALSDVEKNRVATQEISVKLNIVDAHAQANYQTRMLTLSRSEDGGCIEFHTQEAEAAKAVFDGKSISADSSILAVVSHELRTPLNAIIGFSDLLRNETAEKMPESKKREYADLIHGAGDHLLALVNTILDVSKLESGNYSIFCEPFDFKSTAHNAIALLQAQADAKNIIINDLIDRDIDEVFGDRRAVKQVLINLLSNAIKYTPEGGFVTLDASADENGLRFEVSDTGIGMSALELESIRQPFAQIDNTITRNCEGTGLGLTLVSGLVELHGGAFEVESKPGVGTRAAVYLPAECEVNRPQNETLTKLEDFMAVANSKIKEEISNDERKAG